MLEKQRQAIDMIDKEIVRLFEKRMQIALEVARIKKENNLMIFDKERENVVYEKVTSYLEDDSLSTKLKDVYFEMMRVSKDYQAENLHHVK